MSRIIKSIILIQCLLALAYAANEKDKWLNEYCSKEIPEAKGKEFEKCFQLMPEQVLAVIKKCMTAVNLGMGYKDYIKVYCDKDLWKKHAECYDNEVKTMKPENNDEMKNKMQKYDECISKAEKTT